MIMGDVYLNKFLKHKSNSLDIKCFLYVKTRWNDQDMEITLQDSETDKCYHGLVTANDFKEAASDLEIPHIEYKQICHHLLTSNSNKNSSFIYELVDNCDDNGHKKQLLIRKLPLSYVYLDITLKDINNHYDLFDTALELLHNKDVSLMEYMHISKSHDRHYKELHENMERMIDEKNQLERNLLRKVLGLLNAKKERILELERRLEMHNDEQSDNNQNSSNDDVPGTSRDYRTRKVIITDTDSNDDDNDKDECAHIGTECNTKRSATNSDDENFLADTEVLTLQ